MQSSEQDLHNSLLELLKNLNIPSQEEDTGNGQKAISATLKAGNHESDYLFSLIKTTSEHELAHHNYQLFVEISGLVNKDNERDLAWMITKINPFLPIGSFGIFDRFGLLYWKQNTLLDKKLDPNQLSSTLLAEAVFSHSVIMDFRETLLNFLLNKKSAIDCLRENKWAHLIFP